MTLFELPSPRQEIYEWQRHGLCREHDVEEFFYAEGERGAKRRKREAAAREVCARCPVREACLSHALTAEPYGIWGGTTEQERDRIRQERGITRARRRSA